MRAESGRHGGFRGAAAGGKLGVLLGEIHECAPRADRWCLLPALPITVVPVFCPWVNERITGGRVFLGLGVGLLLPGRQGEKR